MSGYFEIRTTDSGVHLAVRGNNHQDVAVTEPYGDKRTAREAIEFLAHMFLATAPTRTVFGRNDVTFSLDSRAMGKKLTIPISYVDQRSEATD